VGKHGRREGALVVGFDGSDHSQHAVRWAIDEARQRGCPLLIVQAHIASVSTVANAWGPIPVRGGRGAETDMAWGPGALLADERVRQHTEQAMAALVAELQAEAPEVAIEGTVEDGQPWRVLADAAERMGAPALVVGATGVGALSRMLIGSTAAELVHNADRPVIVVREHKADRNRGDEPVIVGVDATDASRAAAGFAFDYADRHRCAVRAVHARSDRPLDVLTAAGLWSRDSAPDASSGEVAWRVLRPWQEHHPDVTVHLEVVDDRPAHALLERADEARLLVVGNRGHGRVQRALLGSVSHAALYHATCPVAIVPAEELSAEDDTAVLSEFVLARLDEDQERYEQEVLPQLDEAERRGRLRILRSGETEGQLLLVPGPAEAPGERHPVPFPEKAAYLRSEATGGRDRNVLGLVASVYDTHPDWRERWRP
jgi:nucleotide-binding universal stress UspA family protein